ncbi:MAG: GNAT family N-acetyltransferase [Bacteroidia bacterium]
MIIRKYGITISRLKEKDIELVRKMRNSPEIQRNMYYRGNITKAMQKKWFKSINNKQNGYYIIEYNGKKIGLIHGKNNDYEKRTSEGGIFIWDKDYISSPIPALASLIMDDYTFLMTSFNATYAKVLKENKRSIEYNKLMGYVPCEPLNDDKGVQWMVLTRENYLKRMQLQRKLIGKITGDPEPLSPKDITLSDDSPEDIKRLYSGLPPDIQKYIDDWVAANRK